MDALLMRFVAVAAATVTLTSCGTDRTPTAFPDELVGRWFAEEPSNPQLDSVRVELGLEPETPETLYFTFTKDAKLISVANGETTTGTVESAGPGSLLIRPDEAGEGPLQLDYDLISRDSLALEAVGDTTRIIMTRVR